MDKKSIGDLSIFSSCIGELSIDDLSTDSPSTDSPSTDDLGMGYSDIFDSSTGNSSKDNSSTDDSSIKYTIKTDSNVDNIFDFLVDFSAIPTTIGEKYEMTLNLSIVDMDKCRVTEKDLFDYFGYELLFDYKLYDAMCRHLYTQEWIRGQGPLFLFHSEKDFEMFVSTVKDRGVLSKLEPFLIGSFGKNGVESYRVDLNSDKGLDSFRGQLRSPSGKVSHNEYLHYCGYNLEEFSKKFFPTKELWNTIPNRDFSKSGYDEFRGLDSQVKFLMDYYVPNELYSVLHLHRLAETLVIDECVSLPVFGFSSKREFLDFYIKELKMETPHLNKPVRIYNKVSGKTSFLHFLDFKSFELCLMMFISSDDNVDLKEAYNKIYSSNDKLNLNVLNGLKILKGFWGYSFLISDSFEPCTNSLTVEDILSENPNGNPEAKKYAVTCLESLARESGYRYSTYRDEFSDYISKDSFDYLCMLNCIQERLQLRTVRGMFYRYDNLNSRLMGSYYCGLKDEHKFVLLNSEVAKYDRGLSNLLTHLTIDQHVYHGNKPQRPHNSVASYVTDPNWKNATYCLDYLGLAISNVNILFEDRDRIKLNSLYPQVEDKGSNDRLDSLLRGVDKEQECYLRYVYSDVWYDTISIHSWFAKYLRKML